MTTVSEPEEWPHFRVSLIGMSEEKIEMLGEVIYAITKNKFDVARYRSIMWGDDMEVKQ
tara:strand:- start:157 stop:333 length:177 start_codon:yes stop_codon:yes gene_type:complete